MKKTKVGIVNYLNTKPLLYGIQHSPVIESIDLIQDHPSNIAALLLEGSIDIGLVPVAILPRLNEYHIHTNYCIGCDGPVASVCLFSESPLEQIETVLLDYQSRTSVALLRILLQDFWKLNPSLMETQSDYRLSIKGKTAGLVIGDRSFEQRKVSPYIYDLGDAWKQHTGLPFVFAAWVSKKPLDDLFINAFDEANKIGIENLNAVIESHSTGLFNMRDYYTRHISYQLDGPKKRGLKLFLDLLKAYSFAGVQINSA